MIPLPIICHLQMLACLPSNTTLFFQYPFFFLLLNKGRIFYDHDTPIYFCNFRYWLESLSTTTFFSISILPSFPHFSPVLMVVHIVSVSRKRNNFGAFRVYITHRRQHILRKHLPLNIYSFTFCPF